MSVSKVITITDKGSDFGWVFKEFVIEPCRSEQRDEEDIIIEVDNKSDDDRL